MRVASDLLKTNYLPMNNSMEGEIINRVANSSLITIDLEDYYTQGERVVFDLKDLLFQGMILREKDLRDFVKSHNWLQYKGKLIAIQCSAEAIVPTWAYMLVASKLADVAKKVVYGSLEQLEQELFSEALQRINPEEYKDGKIVIKGCSKYPVPTYAYVEITRKLLPYVHSIMYGEPCSNVPIYKKLKTPNN
jgi:hypothetical protein